MDAAGTAATSLPLAGGGRATAAAAAPALPCRAQALLALLVFAACLAPAAINGLPLVFPDTEGYLRSAQIFRPQHVRAFGYGAFLRLTGGLWSLWLPALAQAALAAWLATRAIALEAPRWPARWRAPAALALVAVLALGHLPWLASWIQADLFTGLLLLALWLLAEHWSALGRVERPLVLLAALGAATMHLTHPPLLAGLGLFALAVLLAHRLRTGTGAAPAPMRRAALLAVALAGLGWGLLAVANWITYHRPTGSLGGSVFLFARLQADGDAAAALRPGCEAGRPWAVCPHLDRLGLPADEFLWRSWSPLPQMGHVSGFMAEAAALNPILLRQDWSAWLANSARRALRQLASVELGNGMDEEGSWFLVRDLPRAGLGHIAEAADAARQAMDGMRPLMPRLAAEGLAVAGLAGLAGLLVLGLARRRPWLWGPALLLLAAWFSNAAIIALGGEVHGRYSARIVWLAPFLGGLLALRAAAARRPAGRPDRWRGREPPPRNPRRAPLH